MRTEQASESFILGASLAFAGGFMDAYSYICRGGVFANAQTGNIILLGINLFEGNTGSVLRYMLPIFAFVFGIIISELLRYRSDKRISIGKKPLHWRQLAILFEIVCFTIVCFIPQSFNWLANSIISMVCGIQVESFRKIKGNQFATTMCIGNLRSGTENLCRFFKTHESGYIFTSLLYFSVIGCFIAGAVMGNASVKLLGEHSLLLCNILLLISFFIMFIGARMPEREGKA